MEHCLHESLAHLFPDARAPIFKCVLGHFRGVSNSPRNMALPTNITLTVVEAGSIFVGANVGFEDYDAVRNSIVLKRNVSNAMQIFFAVGAFGLTKYRRFSVALVRGGVSSYWFAQTLLLFHVDPHGLDPEEEEFSIVQYFDVTSSVDEIDKELDFVCLR